MASQAAEAAPKAAPQLQSQKNYKGFVAGVFSGIAKLTGKLRTLGLVVGA